MSLKIDTSSESQLSISYGSQKKSTSVKEVGQPSGTQAELLQKIADSHLNFLHKFCPKVVMRPEAEPSPKSQAVRNYLSVSSEDPRSDSLRKVAEQYFNLGTEKGASEYFSIFA